MSIVVDQVGEGIEDGCIYEDRWIKPPDACWALSFSPPFFFRVFSDGMADPSSYVNHDRDIDQVCFLQFFFFLFLY